MKKILLFVSVILSLNLFSQTNYSIKGKVTDNSQKPLTGASIAIHELQKSALSDKDGQFIFNDIPSGEYHLHIVI